MSPRTVGKYLSECPRRKPDPSQRWLTFVRNHAKAMVACDFFVVVTARFRIFYVFVLMELSRRTILTVMSRITPARSWTLQQLREALSDDHPFRFLLYDRDSIFSRELDRGVADMGVRYCGRRPERPKQMPFVSVWWARSAGSARISSSRSTCGISNTLSTAGSCITTAGPALQPLAAFI